MNASLLKLCSLFLSELRNDKGLLFKKILSTSFHLIGTLLFQITGSSDLLLKRLGTQEAGNDKILE